MKINLIKEGKDVPTELQEKLVKTQAKAEAAPPPSAGDSKDNISQNEEIELLKSKVRIWKVVYYGVLILRRRHITFHGLASVYFMNKSFTFSFICSALTETTLLAIYVT